MNEWKWSNKGVDLYDDHLLWYEDLGGTASASGGGSEQSFAGFLAHGPAVEGVPPEIVQALTGAVRARTAAAPADPPDFDRLSRVGNAPDASIADKNALYGAAFRLRDWHFLARGEFPDVHAYIASNQSIADGAPMVKAFTDTARLHAFAKECGLTGPDGGAMILSLPVASILPTMESYASQGVEFIHFNANQASDGFYAPLAQLPAIRRFLEKAGLL